MKKTTLIFIFTVIALCLKAQHQSAWYWASQYYQLGDSSVTVWGSDTLTNPPMVRSIVEWYFQNVSVDSSNYSDTSGYSFYADTSNYSLKSDSSSYSDTTGRAFNSDTADYIDTAQFALKADSVLYADTSNFALNATKDSSFVKAYIDSLIAVYIEVGNTIIDDNSIETSAEILITDRIEISPDGGGSKILSENDLIVHGNSTARLNAGSDWESPDYYIIVDEEIFFDNATADIEFKLDSLVARAVNAAFETLEADTINALDSWSVGGGDVRTTSDTIDPKVWFEAESFAHIKLEETTYSDHVKGRVYLDSATQGIILDDNLTGRWNIGSELGERMYNPTGSQIDDGRLVRITGSHIVDGNIYPSIALAGNSTEDSTMVLAMSTTDIPALGFGRATLQGRLNNLDLTGITGSFYLGKSGFPMDTSPQPPDISVYCGEVVNSDNDSGTVIFNPRDPRFDPNPIFYAYFEDSLETLTNTGIGDYIKITNPTNNLFIEGQNVGFTFQGDSVSPRQDGNYTILIAPSFQGDASQSDLWRVGVFVDNAKVYSQSRTSSSTSKGGVPFPVVVELTAGQWISFRIANTENATRDAIIIDCSIVINYQ